MAVATQVNIPHYLLTEYKIYKGMGTDPSDKDTAISYALYGVESFLNQAYGIYFKKSDPITNKFSVRNGSVVVPSFAIEFISAKLNDEDYDVSKLYTIGNIAYSKDNDLTDGDYNFELTYKLGFEFDEIPFALKQALFIIVDRLFEKMENNANLVSSVTDPTGGRMVISQNMPKEAMLLLSPYISVYL